MKVCTIQPKYSVDYSKSDEYFEMELELLRSCDDSMDIIVMPESTDIPCHAKTKEENDLSVKKYNERILNEASATAKRCHAILFINARSKTDKGYRNTTYAFNRDGSLAGTYFKQHLVPGEVSVMKLDSDYSFEFSEPTVIEIEGIRFGFLVCYDFYFYEAFANMARQKLDVIIGCSHQRSDTHDALEIMTRFLAYNTNAYVIRSSVTMDENSSLCGSSMVVAPDGKVLSNMKSRIGLETVDIDINKKYLKPAGFGNPDSPHYEYIEKGRRPWKYRPAGSAIVKNESIMPYPRVCAHRGFSSVAPENSMPAFGAAIAMGAEEIEFDIRVTKDGEIVSIHDNFLDRVSDGKGYIHEYTLEELEKFDFGSKVSEKFKGMKIVKFEEILKKFSCHVIMNIHVKPLSYTEEYPEDSMKKIISLIRKYDCEKYVYFMLETDIMIKQFKKYAPDFPVCVGHLADRPYEIVDRAIEFGCEKVQLYKPYFNKEMIDKAHRHGIICNVFWSDDEKETKEFLDMGIDTILTNDYNIISQVVKNYK
ncbi:MAG: hypothetical protein J6A69_13060 [Clostridia bacterium]|nr:hypothetical protein [Clostridia bacterium]